MLTLIRLTRLTRLVACISISILLTSCCLSKADRESLNQAKMDAREAKLFAADAVIAASIATQKSEMILKQLQKK